MPSTNEDIAKRISEIIKRNIAQVSDDSRSVTIRQYDRQITIPITPSSDENSLADNK